MARRRLQFPNALREVETKSDAAIERETALKWAGRAVACYHKFSATKKPEWRLRAQDYEHEAIEHAALVRDGGRTLAAIENAIGRSKTAPTGRRKVRRWR